MNPLLYLHSIDVKRNNSIIFKNINWKIEKNENWAIIGKSGSGKTSLFKTLEGKYQVTSGEIINYFNETPAFGTYTLSPYTVFVYFQNQEINYSKYYYQQRYYSTEVEGTLNTADFLGIQPADLLKSNKKAFFDILSIHRFLEKELIKLSNGETRKVLIAKALLRDPRLLILDNPYIGLDEPSRKNLCKVIDQIAELGIQIIIALQDEDIPSCINRFLFLENFKITALKQEKKKSTITCLPVATINFPEPPPDNFEIAVKFSGLSVRYDQTIIIDNVEWTVKHREKWALTGLNGSGKSMLLGLIYADHPQAYANKIIILDKTRGKGESIWEIKERIGFVSPEMHFYADLSQTCDELVYGGLYENPYNKISVTKEHENLFDNLLSYYEIAHLKNRRFSELSTTEQKLFILFRAILKNPPILLLDEPFQGFDNEMIEKTKKILNKFVKRRTLIFVSHKSSEVPDVVTKLANLENGKLTFKQK